MMSAQIPANEIDRLKVLRQLNVLDTASEKIYDDLTDLAADLCQTEIAMISLIDEKRQWFKSKRGTQMNEMPRSISLCARTILSDEMLVIPNALENPEFSDHPLVIGGPQLRFYAGVPLVMDTDIRVGTLCVLGKNPRILSETQIKTLKVLARQIVEHFRARAIVAEREQLQDLLNQQNLKIAAASKMASLGEMAAGIAHEINNPLAVVLAWSGHLMSLAEQKRLDPETVEKIGQTIERVGLRISRTVSALRSFARDGEGIGFEKYELKSIFEETLELCQQRFKANGVELTIKPPTENVLLHCRPVEISQVLLNLLNNSLDSVMAGSERWVECSCERVGDQVEIVVKDSGAGVPEELRRKIMDPFFTTKPAGKGTGLGLSISQRIVQAHGGSLGLIAASGPTTFALRLPMAQDENPDQLAS